MPWPRPAEGEPGELGPGQVHVWRLPREDARRLREGLEPLLSPEEWTRRARLELDADRERHLLGRAGIRLLLARYLQCPASEIRLVDGGSGKPRLEVDPPPLAFNLAHAGEVVLAAVARRELGVDVEPVREMADGMDLARRFFAPGERDDLLALEGDHRTRAFFRCWTRKEALLKATGQGLARDLAGFRVSLAPGEPARLLEVDGDPGAGSRWRLAHLEPAPGHVGALAVKGGWDRLRCWSWDPEELLRRRPDPS